MNKPLSTAFLAAAVFTAASANAALVANYTFDNTINSSVGGFTGSNVNAGGTTYNGSGKFGSAVSLQSGLDAINLGSATLGAIGTGDFSISYWVNSNGTTVSGDPAFFSNKDWTFGTNVGINFNWASATSIRLNPTASDSPRQDTTFTIPTGWNNVIVTRSAAALSLYLNGTLVNTKTFTSTGSFASANNFFIGDDGAAGFYNSLGSGTSGNRWTGTILMDDLAVFNTALSGSEISALQVNSASAVPEPSTYGLMGAGALAAVAMVRRRRKSA